MLFKNILFPVDFSDRSYAVAPHVRAVCQRFNAALTLLHLVEAPVMAYGVPDAPVTFDFPMEEIKTAAEGKLKQFAASAFPGITVKTVVTEGDPGTCIAALARTWQIDLIMLPTRGQGRFRAALLGSVAAKTLHDATCAVWTEAHCDDAAATARHTEWRNVVCAIDTVPEGLRLIHFAADLAATPGANTGPAIHLTHAVPVAESGPERYMDLEFAAFLADEARKKIAEMQKEEDTSFDLTVEAGNIPDSIREVALARDADVVLIGRGALPHFAGRLRSHAYAIVRDMPCPVLSV
jgi:nucleotide-binding universal stress UspA family protein